MRLNNISINIKEFITYRKKKDIQNGYVAQTQMENPGGKRYQNLVIRVMNIEVKLDFGLCLIMDQ